MTLKRQYIYDLFCILLIATMGFYGAHRYLVAHQRQQHFYQFHFTPAVLMACGQGLAGIKGETPAALSAFLQQKHDHFLCSQLPKHLALDHHIAIRAWYYMMVSVAVLWHFTGISWSALNILLALLFSMSLLAAYGLYRLGMNALLAVIGVGLLATTPLFYLPMISLRDFGKTPFMLLSLFLLGWFVIRAKSWQSKLGLSVSLAIIVAIGYGFRPDLLVMLPFAMLTILCFQAGGIAKNFTHSIAYIVILLVVFIIVALPILSTFQSKKISNCLWHFPLLGNSRLVVNNLHLKPSVYSSGYINLDEYVYAQVQTYGNNRFSKKVIQPCTFQYNKAARYYFWDIVKTFPADFIARAYKSMFTILHWRGFILTSALLLLLAFVNLRLSFFLLFTIFYFFAYPALHFQERHYAYLAFWYWWPIGFLLSIGWTWYRSKEQRAILGNFGIFNIKTSFTLKKLKSVVLIYGSIVIALAALLWIARLSQQQKLTHYIQALQNAKRVPLAYRIEHEPVLNIPVVANKPHRFEFKNKVLFRFNWNQHLRNAPQHLHQSFAKIVAIKLRHRQCLASHFVTQVQYKSNKHWYHFDYQLRPYLTNGDEYTYYLPMFFVWGDPAPYGITAKPNRKNAYTYPLGIIIPKTKQYCIDSISVLSTIPQPNLYWVWQLPQHWRKLPLYEQLW